MSWARLLVMARKEMVQILRDSRSLMIVIVMPVVLVMLFGYGVNLDSRDCPFMCTTGTAASKARTF